MKLMPTLTNFLININQSRVNATQAHALIIVVVHPKKGMPELRDLLGGTYKHIYSILKELKKKGYIVSEGERLSYTYTATEKGEQVCKKLLNLQ